MSQLDDAGAVASGIMTLDPLEMADLRHIGPGQAATRTALVPACRHADSFGAGMPRRQPIPVVPGLGPALG